MQRRQQSLLSFFSNNATANQDLKHHVLERHHDADFRSELSSSADMVQRQENFQNNFELLKSKLLRPQTSQNESCLETRQGFQTGDRELFLDASPPDGLKQSSQQTLYPADGTHDRPPHALDCRPSIPGIKRIREDHENPLQDGCCASQSLKRQKLLEALGDGDLHPGLWEEARSKFEWLDLSIMRDAKGRKPGDKYFDKRTVKIPVDALNRMTASQKQYWETKRQYMDTILFFKVGKFYELYELDAEIGHRELNWKMTLSGVGKCRQVGVPESGIEDAAQKLVARGYKVARMEQIETAEQAKAKRGPGAMIQRKLTQVLTPSTAMDENMKPEAVHLLALREEPDYSSDGNRVGPVGVDTEKTIFGFSFVDAAAGRFYVGSLRDDNCRSALGALLSQVGPQELLYELGGLSEETRKAIRRYSCQGLLQLDLTPLQPNVEFLDASAAISMIQSHGYFRDRIFHDCQGSATQTMTWLEVLKSVNDFKPAAIALGALSLHLHRIKLDEVLLKNGVIASYEVYKGSVRLDGQTLSNLEIFKNNADGGKSGTLISFLDNCATRFGRRLLRRWMCHPLQNVAEINDRLDAVEALMCHPDLASMLRAGLRQLPDLERLVARVRGFAASLEAERIPVIWNRVQRRNVKAFCMVVKGLLCGFDLLKSIHKEDSERSLQSKILQAVSQLEGMCEAYELLITIEARIQKCFPNLKIQKLKQEHNLDDKDIEVLTHLLMLFSKHIGCWSIAIENLSRIDVLISFAVSTDGANGPTCRPMFVSNTGTSKGGAVLNIKEMWHPFATGGQRGIYVRNDVELGSESSRAMLLTGPNMGGKSTLLRATCLAVILAQLGCYVPAESCLMSPVDIIFTRLGASDRIMAGESTFMVECMEASSVLRYATGNSLVILDELGRGTSTFDGYAIAYGVFRHLVDTVDCRLLFATHYHPLTREFAAHPRVSLQHMSCAFQSTTASKSVERKQVFSQENEVRELSDSSQYESSVCGKRLVFLYKLSSGPSPDSYGLHVASLAGIPGTVVKRAEQARSIIQSRLSSTFKTVAHRELFSHLHDQWLRTIFAIANVRLSNCKSLDLEDGYDTLLCIWHELQSCTGQGKRN